MGVFFHFNCSINLKREKVVFTYTCSVVLFPHDNRYVNNLNLNLVFNYIYLHD